MLSCLSDHGLSFDLIQVFHSWLRNMKSCVYWGNECSQFFNVLSGIQQGSLLGPKFFNLVMDKLLQLLENNKLGCHVGGEFAGAFAYADDLIVQSSSVMQLQCILNLCCNFGKECDLTFNIDKSCCGCIGIPISVKQPVVELQGGQGGGLAPLIILMAPLVQLIFRGSGGLQNGPPRAAKRPPHKVAKRPP